MKKLLLSSLIILLVILSVYIIFEGTKIWDIEILGIKGIKQENDNLDTKLEKAKRLSQVNYKQAVKDLEENIKKLKTEKKNYEDLTIMNNQNNEQITSQIQKYEIETLWVTIGNYATNEGAVIKMDVTKGSNNLRETYNLRFTVNGSYISITDFISDIENDTTLGFKIENFKIMPSTEEKTLQATFVCKDIYIVDVDTSSIVTDTTRQEKSNTSVDNNTTTSTNTTENQTKQ